MNNRVLGLICIVGATVVFATGLLNSLKIISDDTQTNIGYLYYIAGIAGLLGIINGNGVGSKVVARALAFIPVAGFAILMVGEPLRWLGMIDMNSVFFGIGWLVQLAGMLLVGILVVAAKTWSGWRRFVPLLCILSIPVLVGIDNLIFGSFGLLSDLIYLSWILLGYVVYTTSPVQVMSSVPA